MRPKLSVVTVTFNDLEGLARTLRSLSDISRTAGSDLEVIVCDGGTPRVEEVFAEFAPEQAILSSCPDDGIYDAMNRGVALSSGVSLWFLNGGDECQVGDWRILESSLAGDASRTVFLFGYFLKTPKALIAKSPRPLKYLWHGLPTSHQAIIYPGPYIRAVGYDVSYSVAGDYALTCSLWRFEDLAWRSSTLPIAKFEAGGFSSSHAVILRSEAVRVQRDVLSRGITSRLASRLRHWLAAARMRALL